MGLLDQFAGLGNLSESQNNGLLAAASQMLQQSGRSPTRSGFGQILGGGLQAFQGTMEAQKRRQQEEEQMRQMMEMRKLQMQEMQGGLQDRQAQRDDQGRLRAFESTLNAPSGMPPPQAQPQPAAPELQLGSMPMQSTPGMPAPQAMQPTTPAQAPQQGARPELNTYEGRLARANAYWAAGWREQGNAEFEMAQKMKEEFSQTPQTGRDPVTGLPVQFVLDKSGNPKIIKGVGVAPDMVRMGLGDRDEWVDKNMVQHGQQFRVGQSPDSVASTNISRQRLAFDKEQVNGTGPNASEAMVDAIGQGKMAPPSGYALRNPKMLAMMERVAQKYPDFDATEYDGKKRAMRDFTTGKQGDSIRSFAVATDHLSQLKGLITALDNRDIPLINKYGNIIAQQTGSTAPTNFDAAKGIVAKEVLKSIVAGGGGVEERQELAHLLDNAKTTKQLNGVVDTYLHLMGAQKAGLERQYELSTGRKDAATRFDYKSGVHDAAAPSDIDALLNKYLPKGGK